MASIYLMFRLTVFICFDPEAHPHIVGEFVLEMLVCCVCYVVVCLCIDSICQMYLFVCFMSLNVIV
jgi:hypothetical protein